MWSGHSCPLLLTLISTVPPRTAAKGEKQDMTVPLRRQASATFDRTVREPQSRL